MEKRNQNLGQQLRDLTLDTTERIKIEKEKTKDRELVTHLPIDKVVLHFSHKPQCP